MSSPIDTNQSADIPEINDNDASEELFLTPEIPKMMYGAMK